MKLCESFIDMLLEIVSSKLPHSGFRVYGYNETTTLGYTFKPSFHFRGANQSFRDVKLISIWVVI